MISDIVRDKLNKSIIENRVEQYFDDNKGDIERYVSINCNNEQLIDSYIIRIANEIFHNLMLHDISDIQFSRNILENVIKNKLEVIKNRYKGVLRMNKNNARKIVAEIVDIASECLSSGRTEEAKRFTRIAQQLDADLGKYDPARVYERKLHMYDVQLLRVRAENPEDAQTIVEKICEYARANGQDRIGVGNITKCRDVEESD
jgi:hypothetical protein